MKHEPTLPKNPYDIVVNQHVLPRSAIAHFAGSDGGVEVQRLAGGASFRTRPEDPIFCAMRAWDQASETFRTRAIEVAYAELAQDLVRGRITTLSPEMSTTVSALLSLWRLRQAARVERVADEKINGVKAERELSKESEEILESKGYLFIRGDTVPGRFLAGLQIARGLDFWTYALRDVHWGVLRAEAAHFLVPDCPGDLCVVPVSPSICLCMNMPDAALLPPQVAEVNRQLVDRAHSYYFARDLEQAPIFRRTIPL